MSKKQLFLNIIKRSEGRNRQQYTTLNSGQTIQVESQEGNNGCKWCYRTHGPTDIYRIDYPIAAEHTSSCTQNILQNKSQCLSKFKKVEIIPSIFPNHNGIKLEINTRGRAENFQVYGD